MYTNNDERSNGVNCQQGKGKSLFLMIGHRPFLVGPFDRQQKFAVPENLENSWDYICVLD